MKKSKSFLLSLLIIVITSTSVYSQFNTIDELKEKNINTVENFKKEMMDVLSKDEILSYTLTTSQVLDSVIITDPHGQDAKYKYDYNADGKLSLEMREYLGGSKLRTSYSYDSNGKMISFLGETGDGTNWVNSRQYNAEYDLQGNQTRYLSEVWDGTNWLISTRYFGEYDSNGNMTLSLHELWDGTNIVYSQKITSIYDTNNNVASMLVEYLGKNLDGSTELLMGRITCEYDAIGNRILETGENLDSTNNWTNSWQINYEFNSNGNTTLKFNKIWDGTNWVNDFRNSSTYDSNGNITIFFSEKWDGINWRDFLRNTKTYNSSGNMTLELQEIWNGQSLVNDYRNSSTYDSNGKITSFLYEKWDSTNWVNHSRRIYTNDSIGNTISALAEIWNGTNWELTYGILSFTDSFGNGYSFAAGEIKIYYKTITDIKENEFSISDFSLAQNYPNPFNPSTMVKYGLPEQSNIKIEIFNMLGQSVGVLVKAEMEAGLHETTWNAANLPSGIYFISIRAEGLSSKKNFTQVKKALLLK